MIYVLQRIAAPDYGDYCGFVVRADTAEFARCAVYEHLCKVALKDLKELDAVRRNGAELSTRDGTPTIPYQSTPEDRIQVCIPHEEWLRPGDTTCVLVPQDGNNEVIMVDYLNG